MCGIAGFLSFDKLYTESQLQIITTRLSHRGPDASGYFYDGICGLGHRRLSIIDLSENANQPMYSENDRYVIIYNGEVYNFHELGAELMQNKHADFKFKTSSDTEIILEAFLQYGENFVEHLNGMFAIAIYDKTEQSLLLYRDRIGIKPVFYYWDGQNILFASELKSIVAIKENELKVNNKSVYDFLHLGFIPAPNTIYQDVFKLNPGAYLKADKTSLKKKVYWSLKDKITTKTISNKEEALVKLSDLIMSSVQYQLRSDVPFGVFLSGGIDSSLVTAQAVNISGVKINTFSIGFEENKYNESSYARAVAKHLDTKHHEFIVSYKNAIDLIDAGFESYDEPNADSSIIPTMLVSKLARNHVTVCLSGEGGDELFLGYGTYQWARRLANPVYSLLGNPASKILQHFPSRYRRISKMLNTNASLNLRSHIFSQEQYYFTHEEIIQLAEPTFAIPGFLTDIEDFEEVHPEISNSGAHSRTLNPMEKQALYDLQYYLPDDLLTKVDRASMRYSLETRVPFLDHRVIEFAINLSSDLKYHQNTPKYILKEILYQYVPKELFDRPKQGFSIPLNKWLKGELRYLIDDYLAPSHIQQTGFVKPSAVAKILEDYFKGNDYLFMRVWQLITLHKWAKDHKLNL